MQKQILMNSPRFSHRLRPIALALATAGLIGLAHAGPQDGVVRAGAATISGNGAYTRIDQSTGRAIIDWRGFSIGAGEQVQFVQPSASASILNRVTGSQVSTLLGRLDANGQVLLVNPNGIIIGKGGQINVASFIASTSNISNNNFMQGRLIFDQPGKAGAGILNAGSITAAEGGLVALVAPHVRNDGLIQARLGKVMLGAADTFTIDLYGDQLVNLALSDSHVGQLYDANGQPVQNLITQAGRIEAGQAVLVTASTARNVLDSLINMSGTIRAETAVQDGGRIVLLGEGGKVSISGTLDASGNRGGQIEVLGQDVSLAASANLNANGANGGGTIHAGGAWQGSGTTYRAQNTTVEAGANLTANALTNGNGGEVVVWSDGHTAFAGNVEAKGGAQSGDGGRMEVSGKGTLAFSGTANASAANGASGTLLLDPTILDVGVTEANAYNTTLRTGTSIALQADVDININSIIDGRGGTAGGGISMNAGNNINLNDFVVTNTGSINLVAGNQIISVPAKGLFSFGGNIALSSGAGMMLSHVVAGGGSIALSGGAGAVALGGDLVTSGAGNISVNTTDAINSAAGAGIYTATGAVDVTASGFIAGIISTGGGTVTLNGGSGGISLNDFVVTNGGALNASAAGALNVAAGKGIFTTSGAINLSGAPLTVAGTLSSTGTTTLNSTGAVTLANVIGAANGALNVTGNTIVVNAPILNMASGASLSLNAANGISVNAQIDGRGGAVGGAASLTSTSGTIALNESIVTNNGAITVNAVNGNVTTAATKGLFSGGGVVAVSGNTGVTLGGILASGGNINVSSAAGNIILNDDLVNVGAGNITVTASNGTITEGIGKGIYTGTGAITLGAGAPGMTTGIISTGGGNVSLNAGSGGLSLNDFIVTNGGAVTATTTGALSVAATKGIFTTSGAINLSGAPLNVAGTLSSTGATTLNSTGAVTLSSIIGATNGALNVTGNTIAVNAALLNMASGANLGLNATNGIIVNAQIDGRGGVTGGAASLTSTNGAIALNESIITNNGAITVNAVNGNVTTAATKGLFSGGGAVTVSGGAGVAARDILASGGNILVSSAAGNIDLNGDLLTSGTGSITVAASSGSVTTAAGKGTFTTGTGAISQSAGGAGTLTTGAIGSGGGTVTLGGGTGGITLGGTVNVSGGAGGVTMNSAGAINAAGFGIFTDSGAINLSGAGNVVLGAVGTTGAAAITSSAGGVTLDGQISASNGLTITALNNVLINNSVTTINAPISVTSTAGAVQSPVGTTTAGLIVEDDGDPATTVPGVGAITVNAAGVIESQKLVTSGALTLNAGGIVNFFQMPDQRSSSLNVTAETMVFPVTVSPAPPSALISTGNITLNMGATGLIMPDEAVFARRDQIKSLSGDITVVAVGPIARGTYLARNVSLKSTAASIGSSVDSSMTVTVGAPLTPVKAAILDAFIDVVASVRANDSVDYRSRTGSIRLGSTLVTLTTAKADVGDIEVEIFGIVGATVDLWAGRDIKYFRGFVRDLNREEPAGSGNIITIPALLSTMTAVRDILFQSFFDPLSPFTGQIFKDLTLTAGRDITFNTVIKTGALTASAGGTFIVPLAGRLDIAGPLTVTAGTSIFIGVLSSPNGVLPSAVTLTAPLVTWDGNIISAPAISLATFPPSSLTPAAVSALLAPPLALAEIPVVTPAPAAPGAIANTPVDATLTAPNPGTPGGVAGAGGNVGGLGSQAAPPAGPDGSVAGAEPNTSTTDSTAAQRAAQDSAGGTSSDNTAANDQGTADGEVVFAGGRGVAQSSGPRQNNSISEECANSLASGNTAGCN